LTDKNMAFEGSQNGKSSNTHANLPQATPFETPMAPPQTHPLWTKTRPKASFSAASAFTLPASICDNKL
jgi:hypothetical protein